MIRVFDFQCPYGHEIEYFAKGEVPETIECTCGQTAKRKLSAPPFILEGHSGHFPSRSMKWEIEHEKAGRGSHS